MLFKSLTSPQQKLTLYFVYTVDSSDVVVVNCSDAALRDKKSFTVPMLGPNCERHVRLKYSISLM